MRYCLVLLLTLGAGICIAEEEPKPVEEPAKKSEPSSIVDKVKPDVETAASGIPSLKMLDADKDGNISPEEKGAYVNSVIQTRKEEAVAKFDALPGALRVDHPVTEFFSVPEIEKYQQIVDGLKEKSSILLKVYEQLRQLDKNHDDFIAGDEFVYAERLIDTIKPVLFPIDRNNNGIIGTYELAMATPKDIILPNIKIFLADKWVAPQGDTIPKNALILLYDTDKDGKLSIQEQNDLAMAVVKASDTFSAEAKGYEELLGLLTARYQDVLAELKGEK
jgi:hypothetical protein